MTPDKIDQVYEALVPSVVVCTVAGPRRPISNEIYNGAELRPSSSRPGAYDGLRIPSLFNGRRHAPLTPAVPATVWTPPPPMPRTARVVDVAPQPEPRPQILDVMAREAQERAGKREHRQRAAYQPRPDSRAGSLIAHLQKHGGCLTYAQASALLDIPQGAIAATFAPALEHALVVRHIVDQRVVLALPDFVPPPAAPQPSKELQALEARLRRRVEAVAQMQAEIADLQIRVALLVAHPPK